MKIAVQLFEAVHEPAVEAFNHRLREGRAPSAFLLPARAKPPVHRGSVTVTHHVAVDDGGEVRGGVMCVEHPAVVGGRVDRVVNVQAPLSEGILNPAFTLVGPQLIKHVVRECPYVFVVGMGSASNPLPRLLKALGWTLHTVPFYFRLLRAGRCVRQLAPLRRPPGRRIAGTIAAFTGMAGVAAALAHRQSGVSRRAATQFEARQVDAWTAPADEVWSVFRRQVGFSVLRTTDTLPFFYPVGTGSPGAWWLMRGGRVEGWFGLLVTAMTENPYFGNLVVATLTDCVGTPEALQAAVPIAARQASLSGADLVITNQQHRLLRESCQAAGWRSAPSNFLVATSKALTAAFDADTAYITRRDGDGLTNLRG